MSWKSVIVLCAQALLIQSVFSQCLPAFSPYLTGPGIVTPYLPSLDFTPTSGGGLIVTSASAIPPIGITVSSENVYEGILSVAGSLPFVGTTAMEGYLPTAGAGAINHGCGNGITAMSSLSAYTTPASVIASGVVAPILPAPILPAPLVAPYACDTLTSNLVYPAMDVIEFTATSGGSLPVASASLIPPTGISVASETAYGGDLAIAGELPFVGTVLVDGLVPSAGLAAVNHGCGNGINAMVSDITSFAPGFATGFAPYAPGFASLAAPGYASLAAPGYASLAGPGYGCNAFNYLI